MVACTAHAAAGMAPWCGWACDFVTRVLIRPSSSSGCQHWRICVSERNRLHDVRASVGGFGASSSRRCEEPPLQLSTSIHLTHAPLPLSLPGDQARGVWKTSGGVVVQLQPRGTSPVGARRPPSQAQGQGKRKPPLAAKRVLPHQVTAAIATAATSDAVLELVESYGASGDLNAISSACAFRRLGQLARSQRQLRRNTELVRAIHRPSTIAIHRFPLRLARPSSITFNARIKPLPCP